MTTLCMNEVYDRERQWFGNSLYSGKPLRLMTSLPTLSLRLLTPLPTLSLRLMTSSSIEMSDCMSWSSPSSQFELLQTQSSQIIATSSTIVLTFFQGFHPFLALTLKNENTSVPRSDGSIIAERTIRSDVSKRMRERVLTYRNAKHPNIMTIGKRIFFFQPSWMLHLPLELKDGLPDW